MTQYALFSASWNGQLFRMEKIWTFQTQEKLFDDIVAYLLEKNYIQEKLKYNIEKLADVFMANADELLYLVELTEKSCGRDFHIDSTATNLKMIFNPTK